MVMVWVLLLVGGGGGDLMLLLLEKTNIDLYLVLKVHDRRSDHLVLLPLLPLPLRLSLAELALLLGSHSGVSPPCCLRPFGLLHLLLVVAHVLEATACCLRPARSLIGISRLRPANALEFLKVGYSDSGLQYRRIE
ncbi:hypothetical protein PENTCL1PPCAC_9660 [Pristionchus entomophagus]|uniref:G protein-coupled receptor n=1 Tax=Pristionchus entomophagus TaxID=358040 RepID=A0AAV5SWH2_9BILA|nr:hypothetical protein PENTCL1PPCAC_9660 [Pristionchus entomophagus]